MTAPTPLVMHIVYSFRIGGLENGIVNLLNRLPRGEFRHMIVSLTDVDPEFCRRIHRDDVEFLALAKGPGHGWRLFARMWRLMREHRPAIVHTRNLSPLEMQVPAWAAGVRVRIHGEHGYDVSDPDGTRRRYRIVRQAYAPFVTHYVAVSADLEQYLSTKVRVAPRRVTHICNGVDDAVFRPRADAVASGEAATAGAAPESAPEPESPQQDEQRVLIIGTVGRLQAIKGQPVLIAAVERLLAAHPEWAGRFRVRIVGDGPLRAALEQDARSRGVDSVIEFAGERSDIAEVMRGFDIFVLPSLGEGISNTLLEAMATGLPVVATAVGGNRELVTPDETGVLVPPSDPDALAGALAQYLGSAALRRMHGAEARRAVERRFSLTAMVERYRSLYRNALAGRARQPLPLSS